MIIKPGASGENKAHHYSMFSGNSSVESRVGLWLACSLGCREPGPCAGDSVGGGALLLSGDTWDSNVSLGEAWAASLPGPLPPLVSGCAGSFGGWYMG